MLQFSAIFVQILLFSSLLFSLLLVLRILLQRDRQSFSNWILLLFLVLNAYGILLFLLIKTDYISLFWPLYRTGLPTSLLVPAIVYLYIRSVIKDEFRFYASDTLHLLPFLIGFIQYAPYYFSSSEFKKQTVLELVQSGSEYELSFGLFSEEIFALIRAFLSLFYAVLIIRLLLRLDVFYLIKSRSLKLFEEKVYRWVRVFGVTFSLNHAVIFLYLVLQSLSIGSGINIIETSLGLFISIFFNGTLIFYSSYLLLFPETLIGLDRQSGSRSGGTSIAKTDDRMIQQSEELEEEFNRIKSTLETEKLYLDSNLKIQDLAQTVGLSVRRTSYLINSFLNQNFNQVINAYRVKEVIKKIDEGYLDEFTMDALWSETGFSNRTTFFQSFKEVMGKTPGQYLKEKGSDSRKGS